MYINSFNHNGKRAFCATQAICFTFAHMCVVHPINSLPASIHTGQRPSPPAKHILTCVLPPHKYPLPPSLKSFFMSSLLPLLPSLRVRTTPYTHRNFQNGHLRYIRPHSRPQHSSGKILGKEGCPRRHRRPHAIRPYNPTRRQTTPRSSKHHHKHPRGTINGVGVDVTRCCQVKIQGWSTRPAQAYDTPEQSHQRSPAGDYLHMD